MSTPTLAVIFNDHYGDDDEGCACGLGPTVNEPDYDHAGHLEQITLAWLDQQPAEAPLREGIEALLADLKKAEAHHFSIGLMGVRLRALLGGAAS